MDFDRASSLKQQSMGRLIGNSRPDGPTLIFYISFDENNSRPDGPTLVFYISWEENNSRPDGPTLIFYKYPVTKTTLGQMDRHLSFINIL